MSGFFLSLIALCGIGAAANFGIALYASGYPGSADWQLPTFIGAMLTVVCGWLAALYKIEKERE